MANEGFAQIRNGLKEHIEAGKLCPTDLGVYTFLQLYCDYATGIYTGTALGISYRMGDATLKNLIQHSLNRLRKSRFINYRNGNGKRGGYAILIDKYEPNFGALKGRRLNAWKYEDKVQPTYEPLRGKSDGHSDSGVTVEPQLSDGGVTVEAPYPYIHTVRREDGKTLHTTNPSSVRSSTATLSTPTEAKPEEPAATPTESSLLPSEPTATIPSEEEDDLPVLRKNPVLKTNSVPVSELTNIRDWDTPTLGFSAERLRNCLVYVLDYRKDPYYRDNPPTIASMENETFVRKLNKDTPLGWTPDIAQVKEHTKQRKIEGLLNYKMDKPNFD
jgi:hypothetical protein